MPETCLNQEVQICSFTPTWTDEFNLSSAERVELGYDVSIGNKNGHALEPFEVAHLDNEEEMQLQVEATLENDEQMPSTSSMDMNFMQTSSINQEDFNQLPSKQFENVCTCCHRTVFNRKGYVIFRERNYNFDHAIVHRALFHTYHFCAPGRMEYICKLVITILEQKNQKCQGMLLHIWVKGLVRIS